jgi:hypothetical protein
VYRLAALCLLLAIVLAPLGWVMAASWSGLARGAFFAFLALFVIVGALTAWRERTELWSSRDPRR